MNDQEREHEVDEGAESLLSRTKLARRVPQEVREEIHAVLCRPVRQRASLAEVWRQLRLKERFGVGEHAFKDYARRFRLLEGQSVRGRLMRHMGELLTIPEEYEQSLREKGRALLVTQVGKALEAEDLPPADLVKLADALAKAQAAASQAAEDKRRARKARLEEQALRSQIAKNKPLTNEQIYEHVQRIYGVSMNGWVRPETRQHLARERLKEFAKDAGIPPAEIEKLWGQPPPAPQRAAEEQQAPPDRAFVLVQE